MSTVTRPELSKKNKYWISKHRYYELKHFCLQYDEFKQYVNALSSINSTYMLTIHHKNGSRVDETFKKAVKRERYLQNIKKIENIAMSTDDILGPYILKAVTKGLSYTALRTKYSIPCCKNTYYELYRKFFWLLSVV